MTLNQSHFREEYASTSTCLRVPGSHEGAALQAARTLETHEASFAMEYLRAACQGAIPGALRQRIGESDLIQDALLKAAQSIGQFRGSTVDSFRCWLREIYQSRLKNLVRAHITSQKRSVRREEFGVEETTVDNGSCSGELIRKETTSIEMQIMNQTFEQLSYKDQQIVELHSRRGLSFDKVAVILCLSEVSVRKRYTRAIHRWRKLVQKASRN
jgi:RNA polymerase sigma-70 factor, ECF subfamily